MALTILTAFPEQASGTFKLAVTEFTNPENHGVEFDDYDKTIIGT
jgi:hypothetical protein